MSPTTTRTTEPDDGRILLGVSGWLARRYGIAPGVVRLAFVVLTMAGGIGIALYIIGWAFMEAKRDEPPPPTTAEPANDPMASLAVGMIVLGILLFARRVGIGFVDSLVWPVALVGAGLAVVWPHLGEKGVVPLLGGSSEQLPASGRRHWHVARILGGLALLFAGLTLFVAVRGSFTQVRDGFAAVVVIVGGLALVIGPWVWRLVRTLVDERSQRVRSDERAAVAAHLHDSVLQTLTLIQHRADDPAAVTQLARRQERELRRWLFDREPLEASGLRQLLDGLVEEIEDRHLVAVELVAVGDAPVDDRAVELVAAAREAIVNAAKFSGETTVSVYAEVTETEIELYVRDTGAGFDVSDVEDDRHGVSDSIIGRMQRIGGMAAVTSRLGEGTEVELMLPIVATGESIAPGEEAMPDESTEGAARG